MKFLGAKVLADVRVCVVSICVSMMHNAWNASIMLFVDLLRMGSSWQVASMRRKSMVLRELVRLTSRRRIQTPQLHKVQKDLITSLLMCMGLLLILSAGLLFLVYCRSIMASETNKSVGMQNNMVQRASSDPSRTRGLSNLSNNSLIANNDPEKNRLNHNNSQKGILSPLIGSSSHWPSYKKQIGRDAMYIQLNTGIQAECHATHACLCKSKVVAY